MKLLGIWPTVSHFSARYEGKTLEKGLRTRVPIEEVRLEGLQITCDMDKHGRIK